ncbi:methyltransferase domain-containing protein [Streptomyces sp. NPDC048248]|uniref:methyltransferase domain-containing protein n=1 Tax=Streptomyces sp. NPDC048248 TaxID=3365523 RepID=UPI00371F36EB
MSTSTPVTRDDTAPWGADPYADALRSGRGPLFLRRTDGWLLPLEVERWCAGADAADLSALRRCEGPVLDIGCGPGRLVAALHAQGRRALGIDVSEAAVARTSATGGAALCASVFDSLPDEGHWGTALLLDGNIGIGGDPRALLARIGELLGRQGLLLVETTPADIDERVQVRVDDLHGPRRRQGSRHSWFPWARVGTPALLRHAAATGWTPTERWTVPEQQPATGQGRRHLEGALPGQGPFPGQDAFAGQGSGPDQPPAAGRCFVALRRRAEPLNRG